MMATAVLQSYTEMRVGGGGRTVICAMGNEI